MSVISSVPDRQRKRRGNRKRFGKSGRIHPTYAKRSPAMRASGAIFLKAHTNPSSKNVSYTSSEGYHVFGEAAVQWIHYMSDDGIRRYEHRTSFVFKEDSTNKNVVRMPENSRHLAPGPLFR